MLNQRILTLFAVLSSAATPNLYAAHCSNASLNGTYAYSSQGFDEVTPDVSPAGFVPSAQTGLIVYDGKGHISSGTLTASTTNANGGSFRATFTGTYAVNDDCSGMATLVLGDGSVFHFDLVVQSPSAYTAINTDPGVFLSVYLVRRITGEN
jgi:hypothetical protein